MRASFISCPESATGLCLFFRSFALFHSWTRSCGGSLTYCTMNSSCSRISRSTFSEVLSTSLCFLGSITIGGTLGGSCAETSCGEPQKKQIASASQGAARRFALVRGFISSLSVGWPRRRAGHIRAARDDPIRRKASIAAGAYAGSVAIKRQAIAQFVRNAGRHVEVLDGLHDRIIPPRNVRQHGNDDCDSVYHSSVRYRAFRDVHIP